MATKTAQTLYTIGYEGLDLDEFIMILRDVGITHVADVRERPMSRKKGFSLTSLSEALEQYGIEYSNWRMLGTPADLRNRYKADHDRDSFFEEFRAVLESEQDAIQQLADLAGHRTVALLCFEADAGCCHRTVVSEAVCHLQPCEIEHI